MLITNSEFNHIGKIEFVTYSDIFLYASERVTLPPGRYEFDFENKVTISIPEKASMLITSFFTEPKYEENIPVPDIPDMMEDSQRQLVGMIDAIIKERGYILPDEPEEIETTDEVVLDTVSRVIEEPDTLSTEPEPVVTPEPDSVQAEPVVTEPVDSTQP